MKTAQPRVPDPKALAAVQAVADLADPYSFPAGYGRLFAKAMAECSAWHAQRSEFYRRLLKLRGVRPSSIKNLPDCDRLPFVPANAFKAHEILSIPKKEIFAHFTSSGTTGQKSQIFFDRWSFSAGQRMVDRVFEYFGFVTPETRTNYLLYSYETEPDSSLGTAYTDNYLCKYAPAKTVFHALRRTGTGSHEFDVFGCIRSLQDYEAQGLPVRIFGFPAFLFFTLRRMLELKIKKLRLSPESLVFLGGGWKGHAEDAAPKKELYDLAEERLGVPRTRIRDSFGAVEHPIPYAECARHHFHVPAWSQVVIRDVRTLKPLGLGKPGFIQFLTPFLTSIPAHSVLMGDSAALYPAAECGCGIKSPYFTVHGRAGTSKNKSCALAAAELLGAGR
ncbi:MAG: acyl-protein synthase [Elusimicrobia bacterium]|nr:acyl-protein synthase [Elusimicrobiota bacterium]